MYLLTKKEGSIESGAFATVDNEGTTIVQFFVDRDDAVSYNIQLEALGEELFITETKDDNVDRLCDVMGYAYSVIEPGEVIFPRMETIQNELFEE